MTPRQYNELLRQAEVIERNKPHMEKMKVMNNKQTAVEWLEREIEENFDFTIYNKLFELFEQAKEIEKQQHQATFNQGYDRRTYLHDLEYGGAEYWNEEPKEFEQYYNEEYNK